MKIIVELHHRGHVSEYVNHILNGFNEKENIDCLFFLSPYLKPLLIGNLSNSLKSNIHYFSEEIILEFNNCKSNKEKSKFYWKQIFNIKKQYHFDHVLFLNLNISFRHKYILNPWKNPGFTFSGIFFQSPYSIPKNNYLNIKKRIRRELMLKLLVINKNCNRILLLNDKEGSTYYSKWSSKIQFLPDPINKVKSSELNVHEYHGLSKESFIFLHIGALGQYKGSTEILEAIKKLPKEFFIDVIVLFVGYMDENLIDSINQVNNVFGKDVVGIRNEFLSENDFAAYLDQCQCILIANKNVESSSGILNHSLSRTKNIIAPGFGFYKNQLNNYKGCLLFNEYMALEMAMVIMKNDFMEITDSNKFDSLKYYEANSPNRFFEILLQD